jgi:hypothetical protein
MYNSDMPTRAELPTSGQLLRSTLIAAGVAGALLVTVVLPAEYGIDPTGTGRALGLTQMGEIKTQLHKEAEADRLRDQAAGEKPAAAPAGEPTPDKRSSLFGTVFAQVVIGPAAAHEPTRALGSTESPAAGAARSDETTVTLKPGEGIEIKLDMKKGAQATYAWTVQGGTVNHDTHGEPFDNPDAAHTYVKGRGVSGDKGVLTAAFDGNHGWFWRNRGSKAVTIKLTTNGEYGSLKRVK